LFVLPSILSLGASSGPDSTVAYLQSSFEQTNRQGETEESVRGVFHYVPARSRILLEVHDPVVQWIVIDSAETMVYYPNEKQVFRLTGGSLSPYQIFAAFWEGAPLETGLSSLGFEACSTSIRGDSLESWWKPTVGIRGDEVRVRWVFRNDYPVCIEFHGRDGKIVEGLRFGGYVESRKGRIPLEIEAEQHYPEPSWERIVFSPPLPSSHVPAFIREFTIPDDVRLGADRR
jgi:hypothetical protein